MCGLSVVRVCGRVECCEGVYVEEFCVVEKEGVWRRLSIVESALGRVEL